jgi:hypothetical protein
MHYSSSLSSSAKMAISSTYKSMLTISNSNKPPKSALKGWPYQLIDNDTLDTRSRHLNCANAYYITKSKRMLNNNGAIL